MPEYGFRGLSISNSVAICVYILFELIDNTMQQNKRIKYTPSVSREAGKKMILDNRRIILERSLMMLACRSAPAKPFLRMF